MRPADVHSDLWRVTPPLHRLLMLFYRLPVVPLPVRDTVWVWRVNRTPGPRHKYPWQR